MDIYSILKEKALDDNFKNKIIYYDIETYRSYTFNDVFNNVNNYINMFSELNLHGKKKYLIVDNSVDSVELFIALLYCGAIPVLINKYDLMYDGEYYGKHVEELDKKLNYCEQLKNLKNDYIIANDIQTFLSPQEEIFEITKYIESIENNDINENCDFYICTSGTTTGNCKLVSLNQKELISASVNNEKNYSILTTISIASISGTISNVFRPIISNVQNFMLCSPQKIYDNSEILKYISYCHINKVLLPRNILDMLNDDLKSLDFSSLNTIYLSGEINSIDTIFKVKEYFTNLHDNVFVSLYGRTENFGIISSCREEKIVPLYINIIESNRNELIYTFDKKNFFKLYICDNVTITRKVNMQYDEIYYASYIPVSEKRLENINIDNNSIIGEIIVNGVCTGDCGIYLNNQLYVIGRKNDIIMINNKQYFLSMIEQLFNNITKLKSAAIYNKKTNNISVVINYVIDSKASDNFRKMIPLSKKCNEIVDKLKLPIEYPLFVSPNHFPKNKLMRKTKKTELSKLVSQNHIFQQYVSNYNGSFLSIIENIIANKYNKRILVSYKDDTFAFKKTEITFQELIELEDNVLGYTYFREDSEYFYFKIDDCLLFNKYPDFHYYNCSYFRENINSIKVRYAKENESFSQYFNRLKSREIHYSCLKIFCITYEDDDFFIFEPYQIAGNNNYSGMDKIYGKDIPFSNYGEKLTAMIYLENANNLFYSDRELLNKINFYSEILNHTYRIKKDNCDFYVDGNVAEKNNIIYTNLIHSSFRIRHAIKRVQLSEIEIEKKIYYDKIMTGKNNLINVNSFSDFLNIYKDFYDCYHAKFFYNDFKMFGVNFREPLTFEDQLAFIVKEMISTCDYSIQFTKLDLTILVAYNGELNLCMNSNMELFNLCKKNTIKRIYNLILAIRKIGKINIIVNGVNKIIDFSNTRLTIICSNDELSDLDYIVHTLEDCNIIELDKDVKVLRRV